MKKRLCASWLIASLALSGCAVDVLYLAVIAAEEGFTIKYFPKIDRAVKIEPSLDAITLMPFKRHFMREDGKCNFDGVIVPWERTWTEEVNAFGGGGERELPPAPGKIAGYASVIYSRTCPGKTAESLLHIGVQPTGIFSTPSIAPSNSVGTMDAMTASISQRPQWFGQVVERLVRLGHTDANAQKVVLSAQDKLEAALPELQLQIEALAKP